MLAHISTLMTKWSFFPLVWLGRITAVKMTKDIIPLLSSTYLCRSLLSSSTTAPGLVVYMGNTASRSPTPNLMDPQNMRWSRPPQIYYYAAQLASLPKYHATKEVPLWVALELVDCDPLSVANLLWLRPSDHWMLKNPVTHHSLTLWDWLKTCFNLQSSHNPLLSFLRNPAFYPAWTSPLSFLHWSMACLLRAHKFTTPMGIKPFQSL